MAEPDIWVPLNIENNVAQGNVVSITVPANRIYELHTIRCEYVTNGNGDKRLLCLKFEGFSPNDSTLLMSQFPATVEQDKSFTRAYQWNLDGTSELSFNPLLTPPELHLSMGGGPKHIAQGGIITVFDLNNESTALGETMGMRICGTQRLYDTSAGGHKVAGGDFTSEMIVFGDT